MKKKIEDNSSFQEAKKTLEGLKIIGTGGKGLSLFGIKNKTLNELVEKLPEMKKDFELLSKSPDKFNGFFSQRGWIAHESMKFDLMLQAIELAEKGLVEEAEQKLVDYYASNEIDWHVHMLKNIEAFSIRYEFFLSAYEDTLAKRYYSAVPLLLMMIDGVVNDVSRSKGFFAENTDLDAWDSIAAHSSGLAVLKNVLSDSRKKTTTEEIHLPYRHGILHGKDLGYANKVVVAKCWAAVFAVHDWANSIKQGKKNPKPSEPEPNFFETIKNSLEIHKRTEKLSKKIEEWKSRKLEIGIDIPEKGSSTEYGDFTPEKEAILFAEYWTRGNFGKIASQIKRFSKNIPNMKIEAGKIRKIFEGKSLSDYKIVNIVDCAPAISEVTLNVSVMVKGKSHNQDIVLRFIYSSPQDEPLVFGEEGGEWKFIEFVLYKIEVIGF